MSDDTHDSIPPSGDPPAGSLFKRMKDLGGRENWPAGARARPFRRADFVGRLSVLCPHCQQMLAVLEAEGPFLGFNPERQSVDHFWVLTLADEEQARFWEDGKGILEHPDDEAEA